MSEGFGGPILAFSRTSRFSSKRFEDIRASTRPWRVKNAWPMRGVAFIVGASGARKTFFSLDGLLKLAAGATTVWGRRAKQCGVVYVAAEDPDGCEARVDAWRQARAKHRTSPMPFELVPHAPNLLDAEDLADLRALIMESADRMAAIGVPLGVVAFDTWSACLPGADENSSIEMSSALRALSELAAELDILIVVVAHFGKSGADRGIRGWSGLGANADGVIGLEVDEEDKEVTRVTFNKVKNGPAGAQLSFSLEEIELGFDDDGDGMTSCVIRFQDVPPPVAKRKRTVADKPGPKLILRALGQLMEVGQTFVAPPVPGVPPNAFGVMRTDLREQTFKLGYKSEDDKPETAKRTFNRDLVALIAEGVVREHENVVWRIRR